LLGSEIFKEKLSEEAHIEATENNGTIRPAALGKLHLSGPLDHQM
jgi:hypothetical protein